MSRAALGTSGAGLGVLVRCSLRRGVTPYTSVIGLEKCLAMISALPRAARGRIDRLAVGLWQSTAVESCDASKRRLTLPDETSCWTTDDCWKNADKTRQSQPSLDSASAARPKTRCKRSASVICGSNTRGQLFDSSHAQVQRLSMRRVAAASNKLQPQRCEHERPATPRGGSERPRTRAPTPPTREAARMVRENAQQLTSPQRRSLQHNHSDAYSIAVVPKASCVGSTAI